MNRFTSQILSTAKNGKIYKSPCEHLILNPTLSQETYNTLYNKFPSMLDESLLGNYPKGMKKSSLCMVEHWHPGFSKWKGKDYSFWQSILHKLSLQQLGKELLQVFGIEGENTDNPTCHLNLDHKGSLGFGSHCEDGTSLFLILYIPRGDVMDSEGTHIYTPKGHKGITHTRYNTKDTIEYFNVEKVVPFKPNTCLVIPYSKKAWHGVGPVNTDGRQVLIIRWLNSVTTY